MEPLKIKDSCADNLKTLTDFAAQNVFWNKATFPPKRMEAAIYENNPKKSDLAFHYDQLEYHYKQYLIYTYHTLRRVLFEIRRGLSQNTLTPSLYKEFLNGVDKNVIEPIEKIMHDNELYEALSRHKWAYYGRMKNEIMKQLAALEK